MSKKKKILIFFLLLVFICFLIYSFRDVIKDNLIPIYKVEDRSKNVKNFKGKHKNITTYGWVKVQGTNIDYPIVLKEDVQDESDYDYAWVNTPIKKDNNYIPIFGHNLRNVSTKPRIGDDTMTRFDQLMSFIYYNFSKENKYIQLTIGNKNYLYQIFSVSLVNDRDVIYYTKKYSNKKINEYIKKSLRDSYYKYDVEVSNEDTIISLITCTRFDGKLSNDFKIDAKLVKNQNKGYNYNIEVKESYKKIEKKLEGDGDNV